MPKLSHKRITPSAVEKTKPRQCLSDSETRGFRLVVTPAGTRRFIVAYKKPDGKQSMKALGSYPSITVKDARRAAQEVLQDARKGIDPVQAEKEEREASKVNDLFSAYVDDYAVHTNLSPRTILDTRSVMEPVLKAIGTIRVDAVETETIRKLHSNIRAAGIKKGNKGVYRANRMLAALSKMFSLAIEKGWRTDNPCKGVRKFPEEQRWRNLSEDEVTRLLGACESYLEERAGDSLAQGAVEAIRLLLFTGARLQELLKAEWGHFDLERGIWEKPSSHTKTKRQHWLELEGPALVLLREMKRRAVDSQFLFPGLPKYGGNVVGDVTPRADLKRPWAWIKKEAGLEDIRLHDLRRTTASFMLSGGASLATVGKTLNHAQASTTQRYAHLAPSVQRGALKEVGERIAALGMVPPKKNVAEFPG